MDLQTASLTNSMESSLESPITPNSRTYKGRKRRIRTTDSTTNKIQQGLKGTASVSYRQSILIPINENINGLMLKHYNKEIRNDRRDRRKRSLILKAMHSGI